MRLGKEKSVMSDWKKSDGVLTSTQNGFELMVYKNSDGNWEGSLGYKLSIFASSSAYLYLEAKDLPSNLKLLGSYMVVGKSEKAVKEGLSKVVQNYLKREELRHYSYRGFECLIRKVIAGGEKDYVFMVFSKSARTYRDTLVVKGGGRSIDAAVEKLRMYLDVRVGANSNWGSDEVLLAFLRNTLLDGYIPKQIMKELRKHYAYVVEIDGVLGIAGGDLGSFVKVLFYSGDTLLQLTEIKEIDLNATKKTVRKRVVREVEGVLSWFRPFVYSDGAVGAVRYSEVGVPYSEGGYLVQSYGDGEKTLFKARSFAKAVEWLVLRGFCR